MRVEQHYAGLYWRKKMLRLCLAVTTVGWAFNGASAQATFPMNEVADKRSGSFAFVNATVVKTPSTTLTKATVVVREGKIVAVGTNLSIPGDAVTIDCEGKYIYPSFIDAYADYGVATPQRASGGFNFGAPVQFNSNTKGPYGWNQAIKAEVDAVRLFAVDEAKAKALRELGFGTVLTHQRDGIVRGTATVATLANQRENKVILKEKAAAVYSFNKGTSTQSYPSSLMGSIALLRQSFIDADWYAKAPAAEGVNLSLAAMQQNKSLPQIFEAGDKWMGIRADRIGDEAGIQFIIKAGTNEYQRINEVKKTGAAYILGLNYPQAVDVEDPNDARFVSVAELKHWELAPTNAAAFEKAGIPFVLSTTDLRDVKQFAANLKKAIEYGLTPAKALEALTLQPAKLLGIDQQVGSIENGKLANFIITNGPLFNDKTQILQNWIQGERYSINDQLWRELNGVYQLGIQKGGQLLNYQLSLKTGGVANLIGKDTLTGKYSHNGKLFALQFSPEKNGKEVLRLSGVDNGGTLSGNGIDGSGNQLFWNASLTKTNASTPDTAKLKLVSGLGDVIYPWNAYGTKTPKSASTILIKNATVWTNEKDGRLENTDVLLKNGKIAGIGKNLSAADAKVIDGTGKHITPGIIDEHSHIAAMSINEGGQSVTSEVRIQDNLNPEDINIYRQLSGGVTTSHILHGSANTIGGQTQLIKLRWGADDEGLKFQNWPGYIKFALGENVKRSGSNTNNRFPDTRMGVDQVLDDAFNRAKAYEQAKSNALKAKQPFRTDLELEALVEIINAKRFITCHSYVQSEIVATMRIAEKYGFKVQTFTHILDGYKVADKMKAHGVNASTFSDWWTYKMEVLDAIPYNATLMQRVGLNVAINSDDAEMARRLNQEAAKSIKYGGMSEEDALKMVTLNPAKMLQVDDRVGSLKVGKDADVVVWSNHPLSIYAKAEQTIVDGVVYFDRQEDELLRKAQQAEKMRLVNKIVGEKKAGMPTQPFRPTMELMNACSDHNHKHGLLVIDAEYTGDADHQ